MPAPEELLVKTIGSIGGILRFGSGVMGRSTVALIVAVIGICVLSFRIEDETLIVGCAAAVAILFLTWFFAIMAYSTKYPDIALLEGAEWTSYKRFELGGKLQRHISGTTEFDAAVDLPAVGSSPADGE